MFKSRICFPLAKSAIRVNYRTKVSSVVGLTCRTNENNPIYHSHQHEGHFYKLQDETKKTLFYYGGLPKSFKDFTNSVNEFCVMIRKPALDIITCLKEHSRLGDPVVKYALYGKPGTGKSLSLAHIIHYGSEAGFFLVHVPWAANWFRRSKEIVPSSIGSAKYDHHFESVEWLKHFNLQNSILLEKLKLKTSETYSWSKREITEKGVHLSEIIEFGVNRGKYASACIVALLNELKLAACGNKCQVLVAVDGFNSFFSPRTRLMLEDKSKILPKDCTLTDAFLSMTKSDWINGAVIVTIDELAHPLEVRESFYPRYLLGREGFEHLDPFIPIKVENYTEKEMISQIDYYVERKWLQQKVTDSVQGIIELSHITGNHPFTLMKTVAPN
nr:EOG090X05V1 [Macrothrix elegans]